MVTWEKLLTIWEDYKIVIMVAPQNKLNISFLLQIKW